MKFLTKDVNKSLLVLITFFLVLFIAFTVYYQISLKSIVKEKNQYDEKLGMIAAQLIAQKLNKSNNLKEIALIDKAVLEDRYNEIVSQKAQLEDEKIALNKEIILLKSEIEYQKVKTDGPVAQFRLIQDKNEQISQLKSKIDALCLQIRHFNISVGECG